MSLVDTHCHIQSIGLEVGEKSTRALWAKAGDTNADDVVERAAKVGVDKIICVGCDLEDSQLAVDFVNRRPNCWASIGLHPHEASRYAGKDEQFKKFEALAGQSKVVAVGECGLDYFYEHSSRKDQIKVFEQQLQIAKDHHLPLIFHVRNAFDDFWPIYDNFGNLPGVLHSFTDNKTNMQKAIDRGLHIGVNGIATFAKDNALLEAYKAVPLQRLLLETDAPFLTPTPYRGSINEPMHIGAIADFLASLRGEEREVLAAQTTANAIDLFSL